MDVNTDETVLLRFQRSLSLDGSTYGSSTSSSAAVNFRTLVRTTTIWVSFAMVAWHFPRYLAEHETKIASKAPPYQKTAAGDVILDFSLSEKLVDPATIPSSILVFTSVWIPLVIALTHAWFSSRRSKQFQLLEVATVLCAFCMAVGMSEGTTILLKLLIQRRRPNFYDLCGFDKEQLTCTADLHRIREAHFSFPSGHSSLVANGMTFLVWYFMGKSKNRFAASLSAVVPSTWAVLVGASRLVDKWHHYDDVLAGLILGFTASTIAFHTWYPPAWSQYAGVPKMLLEDLEYNNKLPTMSD